MSSFSCISLRPVAGTPSTPAAFSNRARVSRTSIVVSSSEIWRSTSIFPLRNSPRARPRPRASSGNFWGPNKRRMPMIISRMTYSNPVGNCASTLPTENGTMAETIGRSWTVLRAFRTGYATLPQGRRGVADDVQREHRYRDEHHRHPTAVRRDDRAEEEDRDRREAPVFLPEVRSNDSEVRQAVHQDGQLECESEGEREPRKEQHEDGKGDPKDEALFGRLQGRSHELADLVGDEGRSGDDREEERHLEHDHVRVPWRGEAEVERDPIHAIRDEVAFHGEEKLRGDVVAPWPEGGDEHGDLSPRNGHGADPH